MPKETHRECFVRLFMKNRYAGCWTSEDAQELLEAFEAMIEDAKQEAIQGALDQMQQEDGPPERTESHA